MNVKKEKFVFKITVIGEGGVGKTSLITRYTKRKFNEEYIRTIGAQHSDYDFELDGDEIKLFFWDIAGQEEFHFLRPAFYKGSRAAIIVFSLEENEHGRESIKKIPLWHNDIKKYCGKIPIVLFGNKIDLIEENNLEDEKILKLVEKRNLLGYYTTSAKTGSGVIQAFEFIIKELYNKYKKIK